MRGAAGCPGSRAFTCRHAELDILLGCLDETRAGQPRVVVIDGESGMGRTTLLDQFASKAAGGTVLRSSGEELETELRYGVIEQLCRSADVRLPPALAALPNRTIASADPFAIGAELLDLVIRLAPPVMLLVDDAHLADSLSQLALRFALRRLRKEAVLAVLTMPAGADTAGVRGIRKLTVGNRGGTVTLGGLGHDDIRKLGAAMGVPPLSRALVERLGEHTLGNPSHIRALLLEQGVEALARAGDVPLPAPRVVSAEVRRQMDRCTAEASRLVGAAAVLGMRCELGQGRRLAGLEDPLPALEESVDAGLVEHSDRQVRFPHPLVRAAVYHGMGITERTALHGRAAELVDDQSSRVRHLAAAATEEDEALAMALASFARCEAARGESASAATMFLDAAKLSPAGPLREGRVLNAIECLLVGGDVAAAAPLAEGIESYGEAARACYLLGRMAHMDGRPEDAERLQTRAYAPEITDDTALSADVAAELAALHLHGLRPEEATVWAERANGPRDSGVLGPALTCLAIGLAMTGRVSDAAKAVAAFDDIEEEEDNGQECGTGAGGLLLARSIVDLYSDAPDQACVHAARLGRLAERLGQPSLRVCALAVASVAEYRLGNWDSAVVHAEDGVTVADEADLGVALSTLHAAAVWPLAGLGRWDEAEGHVDLAEAANRSPWDRAMATIARAALASARGAHEEVLDTVTALRSIGAPGAVDEPDGFWPWQRLFIDAATASGRLDEAECELAHFERLAPDGDSRHATVAARLRGSLEAARGRTNEAHDAFQRALSPGSDRPAPFDRAVSQAAYGAFLRRNGRRTEAVNLLRAAREGFERLGAKPWVEICDREMAASGLTPRKRRTTESTMLTPQERAVAGLVAEGKSNRAVASELVVSVNTIEFHLKNVFAKLGITSRSQLVLRLGPQRTER